MRLTLLTPAPKPRPAARKASNGRKKMLSGMVATRLAISLIQAAVSNCHQYALTMYDVRFVVSGISEAAESLLDFHSIW